MVTIRELAALIASAVLALAATVCSAAPAAAPAVPSSTAVASQPAASASPQAPTPSPAARPLVSATINVPAPLRSGPLAQERRLQIREGFSITVFARVPGARSMTMAPWGELLVTQPAQGRIVALRENGDGAPAGERVLAQGLQCPYGMAFHDGRLYVAQSTRIQRFPHDERGSVGPPETVVSGLPQSGCGAHNYRPLAIDRSGNLYSAFGASCNVCVEQDGRRGTVWRYGPDGTGREYARGLRNVVDLEFQPQTGILWGVTNERDQLGDDVPPDPVGPIVEGADYGWPYCYWDRSRWVVDTRVPARNPDCSGLTEHHGVQAHSAPLGLAFMTGNQFPADYRGSLFVGLHGSWNRSEGTGFKVVRVPVVNGLPQPAEDFVTGWLTGTRGPNDAWGRPVDVQMAPDGSLFVSDDTAGAIYRVTHKP